MPQRHAGAPEPEERGPELTHVDRNGRARMVDVSAKPWTVRLALARCRVQFERPPLTGDPLDDGTTPLVSWSEVFEEARLAGIQAAKRTSELIPLCHRLASAHTDVHLQLADGGVAIEGTAQVVAPTGVEMEALTVCATAALAVLAVVLPFDPDASIEDLTLWRKSGGRSGVWERAAHPEI